MRGRAGPSQRRRDRIKARRGRPCLDPRLRMTGGRLRGGLPWPASSAQRPGRPPPCARAVPGALVVSARGSPLSGTRPAQGPTMRRAPGIRGPERVSRPDRPRLTSPLSPRAPAPRLGRSAIPRTGHSRPPRPIGHPPRTITRPHVEGARRLVHQGRPGSPVFGPTVLPTAERRRQAVTGAVSARHTARVVRAVRDPAHPWTALRPGPDCGPGPGRIHGLGRRLVTASSAHPHAAPRSRHHPSGGRPR